MNCQHCPKASHAFQDHFKEYMPVAVTVARVALVAAGIFLAPELFAVPFAVGIWVGYEWPEAYQFDPMNLLVGCAQSFWDLVANKKQPAIIALVITTLGTLHHMMEATWLYVPVAGYMVGQWAGSQLKGRVSVIDSTV